MKEDRIIAVALGILLDVLASGIGSLTNPSKMANTFKSEWQIGIGSETIEKYIGYFKVTLLSLYMILFRINVIEDNMDDAE